MPPKAGDAGLLERIRSKGASDLIVILGAVLIALGGASIAVAGLRGTADAPPPQSPWRG